MSAAMSSSSESIISPVPGSAPTDGLEQYPEPARITLRESSVGSKYLAFRADRETVLTFANLQLGRFFRRMLLDPVQGLVMLMAPDRVHEDTRSQLERVVDGFAALLGLSRAPLGSTRLRRLLDPQNTGAEPDCCFYLGANAAAYRQARAQGVEAADHFMLRHPVDLVVEVGVTHEDKGKQDFYCDLGVAEHWQIRTVDGLDLTIRFLALQAAERLPLSVSRVLPGATPAAIRDAYQLVLGEDDIFALRVPLLALLQRHGIVQQVPGSAPP